MSTSLEVALENRCVEAREADGQHREPVVKYKTHTHTHMYKYAQTSKSYT